MRMRGLNLVAYSNLSVGLLLAVVLAAHAAGAQSAPPDWGKNQSPINISGHHPGPVPIFTDTTALGKATAFTLKNTTGTDWCKDSIACKGTVDQRWGSLKAYPGAALTITFNRAQYTLKEFHFHYPAEHLMRGQLARMEIHFVFHKNDAAHCSAGEYLVVGRLIEAGAANAELDKIFGTGIKLPGPHESIPIAPLIISRVLLDFPGGTSSYRYEGSLTAPAEIEGCGIPPSGPTIPNQLGTGFLPEVVSWVLVTTPMTMSAEQIGRFEAVFPNGDARAPQKIVQQNVMLGRDAAAAGK